MKKVISLFLVLGLVLGFALPASAGSVTYHDNAGEIIFAPGADYSPTDLFENFKQVMPGDHLTQNITVRNNADNQVKVKIYIRSLGAQEGSEQFLSMLRMAVRIPEDNTMGYMFQAAANETAQLTDWVCLGTLYSGGEVNLEVVLDVPVEMGNEYQDAIGYLDWEFRIEEYPVDPDDPKPPPTGDKAQLGPVIWIMAGALVGMVVLIVLLIKRKKKEDEQDA